MFLETHYQYSRPTLTPGVQYGLLLPLSIVFALLAILDCLISIKVDLGILGRIKRIVYNIIGLLNWPTVIISVEAPILCGLFGSMIPIVPAYYFFRGFNLEACCSLHPNAHRAQRRREFNSLIARIRDSNEWDAKAQYVSWFFCEYLPWYFLVLRSVKCYGIYCGR